MDFDILTYIHYGVTIIGTSSIVLKGLEYAAAMTKTKKDDILVGRAKKFVTVIGKVLHFIALSPKDQKVLLDKELSKED